jgi:hydroxymethylbilane synthase
VFAPLRGNMETRLRKRVEEGHDAVVVAVAALDRLGLRDQVTEVLNTTVMLPQAAQGALAVECRAADADLVALLGELDDAESHAAVIAERALLAALEAGCTAPVAALAEITESDSPGGALEISLRGSVTAVDGSDAVRLSATGPLTEADAIGRGLARELLAAGADRLL